MINKDQNGKIVYSDGVEIGKTFLELVQNYNEEEIREKIKDDSRYLINNTFSPVRGNLLEWYPFRNGCTILEIGAGMGSLTKRSAKSGSRYRGRDERSPSGYHSCSLQRYKQSDGSH